MNKINKLESVYNAKDFTTITVNDALKEIKTGVYKKRIDELRSLKGLDDDAYKHKKTQLPAYTFNGTFNQDVKNDCFNESSGFIILDIDELENPGEVKEKISKIDGVYAVFLSPSAEGLKTLVRINPALIKNNDDYKKAFAYLIGWFKKYNITLDKSGSDVRRLCYTSYDADLFFNADADVFVIPDSAFKEQSKPKPKQPAIPITSSKKDVCFARIEKIMTAHYKGGCHHIRLKAGRLAGGFIAGGMVNENDMTQFVLRLSEQISDAYNDNQSIRRKEQKAVLDAIKHGMQSPIASQYYDNLKQPLVDIYESKQKTSRKNYFIDEINQDALPVRLSKNIAHACWMPERTVFLACLAVFSAVACRAYKVNYKYGGSLPLGIYAIGEQPPGASKSRCLNTLNAPFMDVYYKKLDDWKLKKAQCTNDDELDEIKNEKPLTPVVTNTTPEALDRDLDKYNGFFNLVSSEQGLVNSMLSVLYGDSKAQSNNDIILNGFDGGFVSSLRVSRDAYTGHVAGAFCLIAQENTIETLIDRSNGTGLAERFLLLSEQHMLGQRDHSQDRCMDSDLLAEYSAICNKLADKVVGSFKELVPLNIEPEGHRLIAQFRNEIEPHLADGARLSSLTIRGAAAKIDMQIMKVAAILHLFNGFDEEIMIDADTIAQSIVICRALLRDNLMLIERKGLSGVNAEYRAILELFENNPSAKPEGVIVNNKIRTKLFKEKTLPEGVSRSGYVRKLLSDMVEKGYLSLDVEQSERKGGRWYIAN